jgi:hypothetical protein
MHPGSKDNRILSQGACLCSDMLNLNKPAAVTCDAVTAMGVLLRLTVEGEELSERALRVKLSCMNGGAWESLTKSVRQY